MTHESIHQILTNLRAITGSNDKVEYLRQFHDREDVKDFFKFSLCPYSKYNMVKVPKVEPVEIFNLNRDFHSIFLSVYNELVVNQLRGHAAQNFVSNELAKCSAEEQIALTSMIKKNLKVGISAKSVNKVWPKLVTVWELMKASKCDEKALSNVVYPAMAQLKADGVRCVAIVTNDKVIKMSRNGNEFLKLECLDRSILDYLGGTVNVVLDGELIIGGITDPEERQKISGICNKSLKNTISKEESAKIEFQVWDLIPLEDFNNGLCKIPYRERWTELESYLPNPRVYRIPSFMVKDYSTAMKVYENYISRGYEGIILKNTNGAYEAKASKNLIKFKEFKTADLKVVEVVKGEDAYFNDTNTYAPAMGNLVVTTECGSLTVEVGSGFTREQRIEILNNKDSYINTIIELKYNSITKDKHGKLSLFLPIFLKTREDKSIANTLEELEK